MEDLQKSTKRKRVAKNRKKAWRKYSNIQDVEDFLEEQRQQLRTGGLASEKTNDALFFEDKDAAAVAKKKSASKKRRGPILLKVDRRLLPDPRVPPTPKAFPRKNKRRSQRVLDIQAKERQGLVSANKQRRLEEADRQRSLYQDKRQGYKRKREVGRATYDVWGADATKVIKKCGIEADEHYLRETKNKPKKLPPKYQDKPSKLPAVEVVAPGASYNPSLEDHQALVYATYEVELKKQKDEDRLERWHKIPKLSAKQVQDTYIDEMSAGLFQEEGAVPDMGEGGADDALPNPPTTYENRKTKKTKRKEKAVKEKEKQTKAEKLLRIRQNEVYRLRSITKELAEVKEKREGERLKKLQKLKEMESQPRTVGHHKLEEEPMVIRLSDELVGSLRELKPEGHLLRDRYKSFQKRNIIEARVWKRGQKAQYKEYEKKSHKEITA